MLTISLNPIPSLKGGVRGILEIVKVMLLAAYPLSFELDLCSYCCVAGLGFI
jgi:hypothetical protein